VLYEMLTGEPPFTGATPSMILAKRAATPAPRLSVLRPPAKALEPAVARALEREPSDRFDTAADLAAAVEEASSATEAAPASRRRIVRRLGAAALGVTVVALGVTVVFRGTRFTRGPAAPKPVVRTGAADARELYRQGKYYQDRGGRAGQAKALEYFEQALRADSNLAEGYSGLADNYIAHGLGNMGDFRPDEYFPKARVAVRRALALDSLSPEAITSEAKIALFYDFDWDAAARGFSRALALNPHYTNARAYRATLLEFTGRFDAAVTETDAMLEDDPQSNFARLEAARALIFVGRYGQAIAQLRHLLERDSTVYRAHLLLGEALEPGAA